jgi:hypothetical protein
MGVEEKKRRREDGMKVRKREKRHGLGKVLADPPFFKIQIFLQK